MISLENVRIDEKFIDLFRDLIHAKIGIYISRDRKTEVDRQRYKIDRCRERS